MRIKFPRPGWAELWWSEDEAADWQRVFDQAFGDELPGARLLPLCLEAHHTTWHLVAPLIPEEHANKLYSTPRLLNIDTADWAPTFDYLGLFPWQVEAIVRAAEQGGMLLCDDMGLGKTRSAIMAAEVWALARNEQRPRLVIGPAFARNVWRHELRAVGALRSEDDYCIIRSVDMGDESYRPDALWYFVNYDIAAAWATHFAAVPYARRPAAVILDEAHRIKNPQAQRTRATMQLAGRAHFRMLLTGTPIDNRPAELWQLLTVLCGKGSFGTYYSFRRRYCGAVVGSFGLEDRAPSNVDELRERIGSLYLRRTANDIDASIMPALSRQRIEMSLSEKDREKHDTLVHSVPLDELLNAVLEGRAGKSTFDILMRLRKVTSAAKRKTTIAHVQDLLEQGESVVVFAWQKSTAAALAKKLSRLPPITGDMPQKQRDFWIECFQTGNEPEALVATYGALAEGVTLTRAARVVLHDLDYKTSTILQAERRVARIGQTRPCVASWVVADNSIDTIFARLLVSKVGAIQKTLGIDEPAEAVEGVGLREVSREFEAAEWAREALGKMGAT